MIGMNRVGTSREVLSIWGVEWQTKGLARDEVSAPAAHNGNFLYGKRYSVG